VPIVATTTAANQHDVTELLNLVNDVPALAGKVGAPRYRFDELYADRAYDSEDHRQALREVGIEPKIAKRNTEHGSGLGVFRWVVERTLSWLHQFRRLRLRYERRHDIHDAFLTIGCILICHRMLKTALC
jgi:transposase